MPFAYPILEKGYEVIVSQITEYLGRYRNLHFAGRSALFEYSHIHDMFRQAKKAVVQVVDGGGGSRQGGKGQG